MMTKNLSAFRNRPQQGALPGTTIARGAALAVLLAQAIILSHAGADCLLDSQGHSVCGRGSCATDWYGNVICANFGGGALRDQDGTVMCGIGGCAWDDHQRVWCSRVAGGSAMMGMDGQVACYGGCEPGATDRCAAAQ
jgi:hypothetical protein